MTRIVPMARIVVVGAGVSGLTTALHLARNGHEITIIAKHMPGDYDVEYCSPWAGADYSPRLAPKQAMAITRSDSTSDEYIAQVGKKAAEYEESTWPVLEQLARDVPESGVVFQEWSSLKRTKDTTHSTAEWYEKYRKDPSSIPPKIHSLISTARQIAPADLPPNFSSGLSFTSVTINPALYLPWLASQNLQLGTQIKRATLSHISHARNHHHSQQPADVVINCTGLSSLFLGGIKDTALYPGRGQVVLVSNHVGRDLGASGTDDGAEESAYIITRAAGGGTILGGCLQPGKWESQPDANLAVRIMKRAVDLCPEMVAEGKGVEGLSIIRHGVGLRPMRKGSVRIEDVVIDGVQVVMNYGHAGYGYQTSWGCAEEVGRVVEEVLRRERGR